LVAAMLIAAAGLPLQLFIPLGSKLHTSRPDGGVEAPSTFLEETSLRASPSSPDVRQGRRTAAVSGLLGIALGMVAAFGKRPDSAHAWAVESNRIAYYNDKAQALNEAADWYLFELRPLVYPSQAVLEVSDCDAQGDSCPEMANLNVVSTLFKTVGQTRGGGGVVLSKLDRDFFAPMKLLGTASVFDPDTEDDLKADELKFQQVSAKIGRDARKGDLQGVRNNYNEGHKILNHYFQAVNTATELPARSPNYITLMPVDATNKFSDTLDSVKYWQRRKDKYIVKKRVDSISKASKTARFYAKSIFGDDAVSWDQRGDRMEEIYAPRPQKE